MSVSVYRQGPDAKEPPPPRRPGDAAKIVAVITAFLLPWASAFAGGYAARARFPLDRGYAERAFIWGAEVSAVMVVASVVAFAAFGRPARKPDAEPDFTPAGARVATRVFGALFVAAPLWIVSAFFVGFVLLGPARYLDARGAGTPRDATCDVTRCGRLRCAMTCTRSDGTRVRSVYVRSREAPQTVGAFHVQMRRGRYGTWLLELGSIRPLAPSRDAGPGRSR